MRKQVVVDGGVEENGYRRSRIWKTRQCLLISVVERNGELQSGWQAGRQISSKRGVGWTARCVHCVPFMVYELCNRVLVVSYAD